MKIVFTFGLILISLHCFSQVSKTETTQAIPSNLERYQLDYEIKNATVIDTTVVLNLYLDQYDHLREETVDVEVFDTANNVTLILYSISTCQENKKKLNLIQQR